MAAPSVLASRRLRKKLLILLLTSAGALCSPLLSVTLRWSFPRCPDAHRCGFSPQHFWFLAVVAYTLCTCTILGHFIVRVCNKSMIFWNILPLIYFDGICITLSTYKNALLTHFMCMLLTLLEFITIDIIMHACLWKLWIQLFSISKSAHQLYLSLQPDFLFVIFANYSLCTFG